MKHLPVLTIILVVMCLGIGQSSGKELPKLVPNAQFQFEFPELTNNMVHNMWTGEKHIPVMGFMLPSDYTPEGKCPIFIYLTGGDGNEGSGWDVPRSIVGEKKYICVSLPLFKGLIDRNGPAGGLMITQDDYDTISSSYRAMLQKLFDTVPNITPEGSTLGGFSNGAHSVGILLARQDEFILKHFRAFYLFEGGFAVMRGDLLQKDFMKDYRILIVQAERRRRNESSTQASTRASTRASNWARNWESTTRPQSSNITSIIMRGYGHEEPRPYLDLIGQWTRGEKLSEVPPKPQPPATTTTSPAK